MIVISDTSCLSALIRANQTALLPQIFGAVIIPESVFVELQGLSEFGVDVSWIASASWIKIASATPNDLLSKLLLDLDTGEAHAIALAVELQADLLIIDELKGRQVAQALNLPFTGLGGVLIRAKALGLIQSIALSLSVIEDKAGFYLSKGAKKAILQAAGETIG